MVRGGLKQRENISEEDIAYSHIIKKNINKYRYHRASWKFGDRSSMVYKGFDRYKKYQKNEILVAPDAAGAAGIAIWVGVLSIWSDSSIQILLHRTK